MDNKPEHRRITLLGVPVDIVPEERLMELLEGFINDGSCHQIIFLTFSDFLKARKKGEFRQAVLDASLVLPLSRRILRAASFLREDRPVLYRPFEMIIKIFGLVERKGKSAYLLGTTKKRMQISHRNLKDSFPGLTFVGRYTGFYEKSIEQNIIEAIRKASPTFLLAGRGLKGKHLWLYRNKQGLQPNLMLWDRHCYEIFAGKRRKPTYSGLSMFVKGFLKLLIMPWRILLIFRFFFYLLLLVIERTQKKKKAKQQNLAAEN